MKVKIADSATEETSLRLKVKVVTPQGEEFEDILTVQVQPHVMVDVKLIGRIDSTPTIGRTQRINTRVKNISRTRPRENLEIRLEVEDIAASWVEFPSQTQRIRYRDLRPGRSTDPRELRYKVTSDQAKGKTFKVFIKVIYKGNPSYAGSIEVTPR